MTATKTFTLGNHSFTFKADHQHPKLRSDRVVAYLLKQGFDASWVRDVESALPRWETPDNVLTLLKEHGVERDDRADLRKLLSRMFRTQVRDWYDSLQNTPEEEGTPARELADSMDYWNAYAKKFGKSLLRVRAIQHEGTMWFRLGDVAEIAGDAHFLVNAGDYVRVKVNTCGFLRTGSNDSLKNIIQKTTKAVRLFTRRELLELEERAANEGTRKGDWYVTEKGMEFIIGSAARKSPRASAFLDHVLEVLHGRAESMATFIQRKKKDRTPEEILEDDSHVLRECRSISRSRGANPQAMIGQATVGLLGEKLADFATRHGVKQPHRKNLILEMPRVGDDISSAVLLGNRVVENTLDAEGDVRVGKLYHASGVITRGLHAMDGEAALKLAASFA